MHSFKPEVPDNHKLGAGEVHTGRAAWQEAAWRHAGLKAGHARLHARLEISPRRSQARGWEMHAGRAAWQEAPGLSSLAKHMAPDTARKPADNASAQWPAQLRSNTFVIWEHLYCEQAGCLQHWQSDSPVQLGATLGWLPVRTHLTARLAAVAMHAVSAVKCVCCSLCRGPTWQRCIAGRCSQTPQIASIVQVAARAHLAAGLAAVAVHAAHSAALAAARARLSLGLTELSAGAPSYPFHTLPSDLIIVLTSLQAWLQWPCTQRTWQRLLQPEQGSALA